jgi:hypothetical protein
MAEIKLYKSSSGGFKLLVLSLIFVLCGYWITSQSTEDSTDFIMGWACMWFFGLGIVAGFFILLDKRPQIIINETSVWDRTLKQNEIKWEQIVETYPVSISGQQFIAIVTDETYKFRKKPSKWTEKFNKLIGTQNLNLNLANINIDSEKLNLLLNKLSAVEKNERGNFIRRFLSEQSVNPPVNFQKYIVYFFILIGLLIISIANFYAFMTVMITMGVAAVISKWFVNSDNKSKLRKYAQIITTLGFINMFLMLAFFKGYDYTTNRTGVKIASAIENYKKKNGAYPKNLKIITDNADLNPLERYITNNIHYEHKENDYVLELKLLHSNATEFNRDSNEWN